VQAMRQIQTELTVTSTVSRLGWHEIALTSTSLGVVVIPTATKCYLKTV
jgi:hypothetical protein